nr:hypothetical protein StreXyl84_54430 [Streptomyces sp. Xyl84]
MSGGSWPGPARPDEAAGEAGQSRLPRGRAACGKAPWETWLSGELFRYIVEVSRQINDGMEWFRCVPTDSNVDTGAAAPGAAWEVSRGGGLPSARSGRAGPGSAPAALASDRVSDPAPGAGEGAADRAAGHGAATYGHRSWPCSGNGPCTATR